MHALHRVFSYSFLLSLSALCSCAPSLIGRWRSDAQPSPDGTAVYDIVFTEPSPSGIAPFVATVLATNPTTRCVTRRQGSGQWESSNGVATFTTTAGTLQRSSCTDASANQTTRAMTEEERTQFSALFSGNFTIEDPQARIGNTGMGPIVLRRQ